MVDEESSSTPTILCAVDAPVPDVYISIVPDLNLIGLTSVVKIWFHWKNTDPMVAVPDVTVRLLAHVIVSVDTFPFMILVPAAVVKVELDVENPVKTATVGL